MAVFTHITKEDLKDFLKNYSFNNLDFIKGINEGIQNTNYKVGIDSNDYILTIYENITDTNDINFFLVSHTFQNMTLNALISVSF